MLWSTETVPESNEKARSFLPPYDPRSMATTHGSWAMVRIVAGGLTPSSVGNVVRTLHPWGVDVSGGVEQSPGRKDVRLVREFVAEVRAAERG